MDTKIEEVVRSDLKSKVKIKRPPLYKVIFLNDNFTPFEFVIQILVVIFHKSPTEAQKLALTIHNEGSAIIAVYPKDIALSKQTIVQKNALHYKYPLVCKVEKE